MGTSLQEAAQLQHLLHHQKQEIGRISIPTTPCSITMAVAVQGQAV
jgi:hypothetical protein